MTNYEIADYFSLLSKLMDIHGENAFKSKSYSIAAYNIEKLTREIMLMDDAELFSMKGIGDSLGKKIREIQLTGKLDALEKILASTPPGILEMLQVKGLGPKKIAIIWKEMGLESIGELEYACNENRLAAFKGFGAKTQQSILESIAFLKQHMGFHLWAEVAAFAKDLVSKLSNAFPQNRISLTGNIRRQSEVIEYIDIITDLDTATVRAQFEPIPETVIEAAEHHTLFIAMPNQPKIRFHFTDTSGFYTDLFKTTGSEIFVKAFEELYPYPEQPENEETIFSSHQLHYIPPALRETDHIIQSATTQDFSGLIQTSDIKGIIHAHSTWSDGVDTLENMAKAAIAKGYEYLVISDHSQAAYYAQGLKPEQIAAQHQEIDALNEQLAPFKIFKSIEADILGDGSLDYNDQVLSMFDLVIASVHSNLKMSQEKAMDRLLKAIHNPFTTILGHPTGRLLLSREGYPVDHKQIIDACAANNVVVEINAHPKRLDLDWRWISYAIEKGVLLSIDPDAHSVQGFNDVYYGVMAAQKGGLTAQNNLSSFPLADFEVFLAKKKK